MQLRRESQTEGGAPPTTRRAKAEPEGAFPTSSQLNSVRERSQCSDEADTYGCSRRARCRCRPNRHRLPNGAAVPLPACAWRCDSVLPGGRPQMFQGRALKYARKQIRCAQRVGNAPARKQGSPETRAAGHATTIARAVSPCSFSAAPHR